MAIFPIIQYIRHTRYNTPHVATADLWDSTCTALSYQCLSVKQGFMSMPLEADCGSMEEQIRLLSPAMFTLEAGAFELL